MKVKIIDRYILGGIPSASGIELIQDNFWLIGDNSPWLFELRDDFSILHKFEIFSIDSLEGQIIPKAIKHDFEAMTIMKWGADSALFIFGSGSKSPYRNTGKLIELAKNKKISTFDLTSFYTLIKEEANLDEEEMNIEAAAVLGNQLFLFNRGKNRLISMKIMDFQEFILKKKETIKMKVITVDLPEIDGVQAGFSGASGDETENRIIFTASVENTSNWIDDGQVLGSFIGVIDLDKLVNHYSPRCELLTDKNEILDVKVESIAFKSVKKKKINCFVVTDSDGEHSEIIELEISFL